MLPQSLWVLILSLIPSIESHSLPEARAVSFSNVTSTNGSVSTLSTSTNFSSLSFVPITTRTVSTTSESSPNTAQNTSTQVITLSRKSSTSSRTSTQSSKTVPPLKNGTIRTSPPCCFVIQDTVSEDWWQRTSYASTVSLVNLTSYTTYITDRSDITATRVETNVYTTNASFSFTLEVGENPITNLLNVAPTPTQVTQVLNVTQLVTGGISMQSPSAFYVYNTVKIITAEPVTDANGNVYCATTSTGAHGDVFPRINGNAEAYFGGPGIVGQTVIPTTTILSTETDTYVVSYPTPHETTATNTYTDELLSVQYTNSDGEIVTQSSTPSGVVISLVTPFIYAPPRGTETPTFGAACLQGSDTVAYGYIPQTLVHLLAHEPRYSSQYPGIESCYGGGPSILQARLCFLPHETPTYQTTGGDLTSSTTIYVGAPKINQASTAMASQPTNGVVGGESITSIPTTDSPPLTAPPAGETPTTVRLYTVPPPLVTLSNDFGESSNGGIGNSVAASSPTPAPITIQASTTIPISQAPAGAVGVSSNVDGTPVLILGPTTIAAQSSDIVILAATTIPVAQAPPGAVGSTTTVDGTPFLIVQPTTITPAPTVTFSTEFVSGTAFLVIPPTSIPLSLAPAGLSGSTTTINGTPYLVVASSTSLSVPQTGFETTTISGTPYIVIPGPTPIPLSLAPLGLQGLTATINQTPYLLIDAATTIPVENGDITVIGGTTELIITAPTTIPVNPLFSISGQTTVIGGTTMVEVSSPTTVLEMSLSSWSTPSPAPETSSKGGSQVGKSTSTSSSKAGAAPTGIPGRLLNRIGIIAGGVAIAVF